MSWDVQLNAPDGGILPTKHPAHGGTYALNGPAECWLNVTYNYSDQFASVWPTGSLREILNGRRASETTPLLMAAVEKLGTKPSDDYWESTPGNAGRAVDALLAWALEHPDGVWETD